MLSREPVSGEMLGEVLVHLEHAHRALASEDGLKLVIGQDLALVLWVLELMPLDVLPHLAHDLGTGQG